MPTHDDTFIPHAVAVPPLPNAHDGFKQVHFADAYAIALPADASRNPEVLARAMLSQPPTWIRGLMRLRDALVAGLGLKTSRQMAATGDGQGAEHIGIFRIYSSNATEIILGADDRHLDFRLSIIWSAGPAGDSLPRLTASTRVQCHNLLGRGYIAAIAPVHRIVVKACLRRTARAGWPGLAADPASATGREDSGELVD